MTYLPAAFNAAESWPMFQRVYYTAAALGLIPKMHDAVYSAVWTSKELAVTEPDGRRLKSPQPTLEDAARFFEKKAGIKAEQFLATAKSFSVDANCRRADQLVKRYKDRRHADADRQRPLPHRCQTMLGRRASSSRW